MQNSDAQGIADKIPLIPLPASMQIGDGMFEINSSITIIYNNDAFVSDIDIFNIFLMNKYGFVLNSLMSDSQKDQDNPRA